jgi:bifunctional non-homologous end joining protein LigD
MFVSRAPDMLTLEFSKADRGGRIYVDTGRNTQGATFAAAYTVRARPGAPVSAPCTWDEVEGALVHPRSFTMKNMGPRLKDVGDLWAGMRRQAKSLARPAAKLRRLVSVDGKVEAHGSGRR